MRRRFRDLAEPRGRLCVSGYPPNATSVGATLVAWSASALYQIELQRPGKSLIVAYDLYVQVDRSVYLFHAITQGVAQSDLPLPSIVTDLVTTAEHTVAYKFSDATPTTVMGITTGGIYDLLPGPGDVPAGLTLDSEDGDPPPKFPAPNRPMRHKRS